MKVIDNWIHAAEVPKGEVFVADINAMKKSDEELPWGVEIAGARSIARFFNKHDAIEYAEWLAQRLKK